MTIEPLLEYIRNYISLTDDEANFLESKVVLRKYLKGQYIVQQGDVCRYECFVLSGCTKTFFLDKEGQEHILMFSIEDWWTSDMASFITQTPADFNIQCLENTELAMFPFEASEALFNKIPKLERFLDKLYKKPL